MAKKQAHKPYWTMGKVILTVALALVVIVILGALFIGAAKPVTIVDTGIQLSARHTQAWGPLAAGTYEFEIDSSDGITIATFPSMKDYQLVQANGQGAEQYLDCSATKSTRFHQTCHLKEGSAFAVTNPNLLMSDNINVKITKIG